MRHGWVLLIPIFLLTVVGGAEMKGQLMKGQAKKIKVYDAAKSGYQELEEVLKTDDEWKKVLTPEQFQVTRKQGTERPFTGPNWDNHKHGIYKCVGCGIDLFLSETKFDSGTGWPSFFKPVAPENVAAENDDSLFMHRIEVHCPRCGAHLGHVFDDGPAPTHKRYCMNGASLKFEETKK